MWKVEYIAIAPCIRTRLYPQITPMNADVGAERRSLSHITMLNEAICDICVICGLMIRLNSFALQICPNGCDYGYMNNEFEVKGN